MTAGNLGESDELDRSDHHKHMDYVQAIITRLANNSFLMKGWALTLSSALLGFAIAQRHAGLALAAAAPATAFWVLDTYYLRQEHAFRDMYAEIAAKRLRDFEINPKPYLRNHSWSVGLSISLRIFYVAIIALILVVAAVLADASPTTQQPSPQPGGGQGISGEQTPSSSVVRSTQSSSRSPSGPVESSAVPATESEPGPEETPVSPQG